MIYEKDDCLYLRNGNELLEIRPWGRNSFRIRSTRYPAYTGHANALTMKVPTAEPVITINKDQNTGSITNGNLTAKIDPFKNLSFYNQDNKLLLKGYQRNRIDDMTSSVDTTKVSHFNSALNIDSREFKPLVGGDFELKVRFEANQDEKLFGMGQYQQDFLDLKKIQN